MKILIAPCKCLVYCDWPPRLLSYLVENLSNIFYEHCHRIIWRYWFPDKPLLARVSSISRQHFQASFQHEQSSHLGMTFLRELPRNCSRRDSYRSQPVNQDIKNKAALMMETLKKGNNVKPHKKRVNGVKALLNCTRHFLKLSVVEKAEWCCKSFKKLSPFLSTQEEIMDCYHYCRSFEVGR